ncbi:uncharacterized protein LOC111077818 [Drosophila obscura]|uniref:uncharacterized protein LOC111077818 n=1 Tax=Drosophila obscura TaxID=7282 RepID=UPI001BB10868|nr:uncharacterized protein LOC111077818 [Drosophila obscura]
MAKVLLGWIVLVVNILGVALKNTAEYISAHNYPVEKHTAVTQDGYELTLFRIPYSLRRPSTPGLKPAVLLMHGMTCSSDYWVITCPEEGLPFLLADEGYDVWLANSRGNTYSRKHKSLSPKNRKFWEFDWHEIGIYDITKSIELIQDVTGQSAVHYVGHSQGGTSFLAMLSMRPEYNQRIKTSHLLGPAVFMGKMPSKLVKVLRFYFLKLPDMEVMYNEPFVRKMLESLCSKFVIKYLVCRNVAFIISGGASKYLNTTLIPAIAGTASAGISSRQIKHYAQLINSGKFALYDFGTKDNLKIYRKINPPDYPLNVAHTRHPIEFYYSNGDRHVSRGGCGAGHHGFAQCTTTSHAVNRMGSHRLCLRPKSKGKCAIPNIFKPVVFIQHGMTGSSDTFLLTGPSDGLPYMLADAGFDVWLGNSRDNTYFHKHKRLSPRRKHPALCGQAEYISAHNYPVEKHTAVTQDGYELTLFRIPYSLRRPSTPGLKPAVLFMHGMTCSSDYWVITCPEEGLPFLLADEGYDVWLANSRGNTYSRKHKSLSPKKRKFWEFDWHEIGIYDITKSIELIQDVTGQSAVHYVGHSQGCTSFLAMLSMRPEYNQRIKTSHLLGPAVFMGKMPSKLVNVLRFYFLKLPDMEVMYNEPFVRKMLEYLCSKFVIKYLVCRNVAFIISGGASKYLNTTLIPAIAGTASAGISSRQIKHYAQLINSGKFALYDFGTKDNLKIYRKKNPPDYPLNVAHTRHPIEFYYSNGDRMSAVEDVERAIKALPNARRHLMPLTGWGHIDYVFGKNLKKNVNNDIIKIMNTFESRSSRA